MFTKEFLKSHKMLSKEVKKNFITSFCFRKKKLFRKLMFFCQIDGGVTVQPGPKNNRIFFGKNAVKGNVGHIVWNIYSSIQANRFPTSHYNAYQRSKNALLRMSDRIFQLTCPKVNYVKPKSHNSNMEQHVDIFV
jgi:hypothetical protein